MTNSSWAKVRLIPLFLLLLTAMPGAAASWDEILIGPVSPPLLSYVGTVGGLADGRLLVPGPESLDLLDLTTNQTHRILSKGLAMPGYIHVGPGYLFGFQAASPMPRPAVWTGPLDNLTRVPTDELPAGFYPAATSTRNSFVLGYTHITSDALGNDQLFPVVAIHDGRAWTSTRFTEQGSLEDVRIEGDSVLVLWRDQPLRRLHLATIRGDAFVDEAFIDPGFPSACYAKFVQGSEDVRVVAGLADVEKTITRTQCEGVHELRFDTDLVRAGAHWPGFVGHVDVRGAVATPCGIAVMAVGQDGTALGLLDEPAPSYVGESPGGTGQGVLDADDCDLITLRLRGNGNPHDLLVGWTETYPWPIHGSPQQAEQGKNRDAGLPATLALLAIAFVLARRHLGA